MSDAVSNVFSAQTKRKLTHALPTTDYPTPTDIPPQITTDHGLPITASCHLTNFSYITLTVINNTRSCTQTCCKIP